MRRLPLALPVLLPRPVLLVLLALVLLAPARAQDPPRPVPDAIPPDGISPAAPALTDTLYGLRIPPTVRPPRLTITPVPLPAAPTCCAAEAAAVDPDIVIPPDSALHAHIRLYLAPRGIDPDIFMPNPDLSGGCFGVN